VKSEIGDGKPAETHLGEGLRLDMTRRIVRDAMKPAFVCLSFRR